jgi:hypothetical protein
LPSEQVEQQLAWRPGDAGSKFPPPCPDGLSGPLPLKLKTCGLFPFVAGSGTPTAGTPIGRHQLWGEVVCLDPLAWLRAGLVTNPGVFVLGQPGTGKSALVKRLVTGAAAFGTQVLVLGDTKPDYTPLVRHLGGQVIRIGRGLDRINPLDAELATEQRELELCVVQHRAVRGTAGVSRVDRRPGIAEQQVAADEQNQPGLVAGVGERGQVTAASPRGDRADATAAQDAASTRAPY